MIRQLSAYTMLVLLIGLLGCGGNTSKPEDGQTAGSQNPQGTKNEGTQSSGAPKSNNPENKPKSGTPTKEEVIEVLKDRVIGLASTDIEVPYVSEPLEMPDDFKKELGNNGWLYRFSYKCTDAEHKKVTCKDEMILVDRDEKGKLEMLKYYHDMESIKNGLGEDWVKKHKPPAPKTERR